MSTSGYPYDFTTVDTLRAQLHEKLKKIVSLEMIIEEYEESKKEEETTFHRRVKSVEKRHEEDLRSYQENLNDYMESVQKQMNDWEGKLSKANMEISALNHSQQINMAVIQDLERKLQCVKNENEKLTEQLQLEKLNEKTIYISNTTHATATPNKKNNTNDNNKSSPVSVIDNNNNSIFHHHQKDRLHNNSTQRELDSLRQWAKKALEKVKFLELENKNSKIYIKKLEKSLDDNIQETMGMNSDDDDVVSFEDNEKIVINNDFGKEHETKEKLEQEKDIEVRVNDISNEKNGNKVVEDIEDTQKDDLASADHEEIVTNDNENEKGEEVEERVGKENETKEKMEKETKEEKKDKKIEENDIEDKNLSSASDENVSNQKDGSKVTEDKEDSQRCEESSSSNNGDNEEAKNARLNVEDVKDVEEIKDNNCEKESNDGHVTRETGSEIICENNEELSVTDANSIITPEDVKQDTLDSLATPNKLEDEN